MAEVKKKKHICTSCDKLTNAPLASGHSFLPQLARTFHAHSHNVSKVNLQTTTWRSNYMTPKLRSCKRLCTKSSETMHITTLFTDIAGVANKKLFLLELTPLVSCLQFHRIDPHPRQTLEVETTSGMLWAGSISAQAYRVTSYKYNHNKIPALHSQWAKGKRNKHLVRVPRVFYV